jgi:hypothetical protein
MPFNIQQTDIGTKSPSTKQPAHQSPQTCSAIAMFRLSVALFAALAFAAKTNAFAPSKKLSGTTPVSLRDTRVRPLSSVLFGREDDTIDEVASNKKKGFLDSNVRSKLVTESIAPWRTLRLFLYFSAGSGALLGGLITLSGVAAALSGARTDVDLNVEVLNLAIDFGAVGAFAFLAKWDFDRQKELTENVEKKIERKKEQKKVIQNMREREKRLGDLKLEIKVSADGQTREAPVSNIQAGAKQHIIIVAGPKKACKDALIGANLLKMDFAMSNILVVPYETGVGAAELQSRPSGGFGDGPSYENQPYVARVVGDGWDEYIQEEIDDAIKQSGEKIKEEGIVIVVANNGKVIRRGVGKVPWRQMVDRLEEEVSLGTI